MLATLAAVHALAFQGPMFYPGLGTHHRRVSTHSALAQRYFNQGMALMYGFNHSAAIKSFKAAAHADPNCVMAYWGIANSDAPNINTPFVTPPANLEALDALGKAKARLRFASPVERSLVEAQALRFANPAPQNRAPLDKAYSDAMRKVWQRFPRDTDVGALFAESLMDLRPWDLWTLDGQPMDVTPELLSTLERVMRLDPHHPQALHLYVHAQEASPHPELAAVAADRLRNLNPGLGHMVHMPSHIDIRTGNWVKAERANERAIAIDTAYRKKNKNPGVYRIYIIHNYHMLALAQMMRGEGAKAIKTMDAGVATIPADLDPMLVPVVDGFMAMPLEMRKRFGRWDEILAYPTLLERFPIARALQHGDRAVAFAAKGQVEQAQAELDLLSKARNEMPQEAAFGQNSAAALLGVSAMLAQGEIMLAQKNLAGAAFTLERAADAEDQLRYDEPPDWIQPVRHTLGAVYVAAGRYTEAIDCYRKDLSIHPHNGWALKGLQLAYEGMGDEIPAAMYRKEFAVAWRNADLSIGSSCLCVRGK